jgi:hypothetical protein
MNPSIESTSERDLSRESTSERDLSRESTSERDLSRELTNERDLSRESTSERDLSRESTSERDLSRESINERDLSREFYHCESKEMVDNFIDIMTDNKQSNRLLHTPSLTHELDNFDHDNIDQEPISISTLKGVRNKYMPFIKRKYDNDLDDDSKNDRQEHDNSNNEHKNDRLMTDEQHQERVTGRRSQRYRDIKDEKKSRSHQDMERDWFEVVDRPSRRTREIHEDKKNSRESDEKKINYRRDREHATNEDAKINFPLSLLSNIMGSRGLGISRNLRESKGIPDQLFNIPSVQTPFRSINQYRTTENLYTTGSTNQLIPIPTDFINMFSSYLNQDVTTPLTQRSFDELKEKKYGEIKNEIVDKSSNSKEEKCIVCLGDFGDNDNVKITPCGHIFHPPCLKEWITDNHTCPVCRTSLGDYVPRIDPPVRISGGYIRQSPYV